MRPDDDINVPVQSWAEHLAEQVATKVAEKIVKQHVATCPLAGLPERVKTLEEKSNSTAVAVAKLSGMILGGGAVGGLVVRLLGG